MNLQLDGDEAGHQNGNDQAHDGVDHVVRVSFPVIIQRDDHRKSDAHEPKDYRHSIHDHIVEGQRLPLESVQTRPEVIGAVVTGHRGNGRGSCWERWCNDIRGRVIQVADRSLRHLFLRPLFRVRVHIAAPLKVLCVQVVTLEYLQHPHCGDRTAAGLLPAFMGIKLPAKLQ